MLTDVRETFNIAPTQDVPIVLERAPKDSDGDPAREIRAVRWGLIPSWSTEAKGRGLINARSESITSKPSFRVAAGHRRAIAPANGYFEWEARPHGKQPFFLHGGGSILKMAALYEWWADPSKAGDDPTQVAGHVHRPDVHRHGRGG